MIGPEEPVMIGSALSVYAWAENPAIPAPISVLEALQIRGDISDKGKVWCRIERFIKAQAYLLSYDLAPRPPPPPPPISKQYRRHTGN